MIGALTSAEALEILKSKVSWPWLVRLRSTPLGQCMLDAIIDVFVAVDKKDAEQQEQLKTRPTLDLEFGISSSSSKATTTLEIVRKKHGRNHIMPAGTIVQTPDGHTYSLDESLSFGQGEIDVPRTATATAVYSGYEGEIIPGAINQFAPLVAGLSGIGTHLEYVPGGGTQPKALKIGTNSEKPHFFKDYMIGQYIEITACPTNPENVGKQIRIGAVNDGLAIDSAPLTESPFAWSGSYNTTTNTEISGFTAPGALAFEWEAKDWPDLGYIVRNTTKADGGVTGLLDTLAESRGRPRDLGETDAQVLARLNAAPLPPSPLALLRKALRALAPWGVKRRDVLIYELRELPADASDPYQMNFPGVMGFISDLHCSDMSTPLTPDEMAQHAPDKTTLGTFLNPGLALVDGPMPRILIVRWDPPVGMSAETLQTATAALWVACKLACAPGTLFNLYNLTQWGYTT